MCDNILTNTCKHNQMVLFFSFHFILRFLLSHFISSIHAFSRLHVCKCFKKTQREQKKRKRNKINERKVKMYWTRKREREKKNSSRIGRIGKPHMFRRCFFFFSFKASRNHNQHIKIHSPTHLKKYKMKKKKKSIQTPRYAHRQRKNWVNLNFSQCEDQFIKSKEVEA